MVSYFVFIAKIVVNWHFEIYFDWKDVSEMIIRLKLLYYISFIVFTLLVVFNDMDGRQVICT